MPAHEWAVDDTLIKVTDHAGMLTIVDVGDQRFPIPARTLGVWILPVPDRHVQLETRRNLDVLRHVVVSDGYELPPKNAVRRAAASGTRCTPHDAEAICRCARCDAASCRTCTPDGWHCTSCLLAIAEQNRALVSKLRRRGVMVAFGFAAITIAVGFAIRVPIIGAAGVAAVGLTLWLWLRGTWLERAERKRGLRSAVDTPGIAIATAVVVQRDRGEPR